MSGTVAPRRDALLELGTRLAICALLHGAVWVDFAAVRTAVQVTDSSLSKHSRTLEEAGYLDVRKGAAGRRARTWFRLTPAGRRALEGHLAWLEYLQGTVPAPVGQQQPGRARRGDRDQPGPALPPLWDGT
ncbi:MAG TPA: transcriptional regulator [Trebonia sp.]